MIAGIFFFARPLANWAICPGAPFPSNNASTINCPEAPNTSESTLPNFIFASSRNLLHSILFRCACPIEPFPPAGQVPQFSNRTRWYEAGMDHGVAQQMRQPPTVFVVCLVAPAVLYLVRIRQVHFHAVFQNIEYGFPIRPCAFHHHMRDRFLAEPFPQS